MSAPAFLLPDCSCCGQVQTGRGQFLFLFWPATSRTFHFGCGSLESCSVSFSVIVSPLMSVFCGQGLRVIFGSPAPGTVLVHESEGKTEIDEQSVRQEGVGRNLSLADC